MIEEAINEGALFALCILWMGIGLIIAVVLNEIEKVAGRTIIEGLERSKTRHYK